MMVNKMDNKIKKAISKAMAKLVGFSLNEKATKGNSVQINLMGQYDHDIWVTDNSCVNHHIDIILTPRVTEDIPAFERVIEKKMADLKARFLDPKKTWIELNAEVIK